MSEVDWEQRSIEAHNRHELWVDVANHLRVAKEAVEQAQGALDDLDEGDFAEQLDPIFHSLRRAANDAGEYAQS